MVICITSTADRIILEPVPLKLTPGSGWYVKATHPDGRIEHVTGGFKSEPGLLMTPRIGSDYSDE
jgi:hypothetical protein